MGAMRRDTSSIPHSIQNALARRTFPKFGKRDPIGIIDLSKTPFIQEKQIIATLHLTIGCDHGQ
jgi:hypothetical protein